MNLARRFLIACSLLTGACATVGEHDLSGGAAGPATVTARDTVLVQSVDGREQDGVFIGQEHRYLVTPGEHVWIVRYSDIFYGADDTHDKVVSPPVRIRFTANAGGRYAFSHAPHKELAAAREFARQPRLTVVDETAGQVVASVAEVGEDSGFFTTGQLPVDKEAYAADAPGTGDPAALDSLKTGWKAASEAQRRTFLEWIKSYPR